jgi:hypothetical protein
MAPRPVQPDIGERRGEPENARELRTAHDAVGRPVMLEDREHILDVPGRVPELQIH